VSPREEATYLAIFLDVVLDVGAALHHVLDDGPLGGREVDFGVIFSHLDGLAALHDVSDGSPLFGREAVLGNAVALGDTVDDVLGGSPLSRSESGHLDGDDLVGVSVGGESESACVCSRRMNLCMLLSLIIDVAADFEVFLCSREALSLRTGDRESSYPAMEGSFDRRVSLRISPS